MKGYKAFDSNWKCKDTQYKIGKTTTFKGKLEMCQSGIHFCENPLDVLRYYPPDSKFAEVDADKVSDEVKKEDSKRVCGKIKLTAELKLSSIIQMGVKFCIDKFKSTSGDASPAATSGKNSISCSIGRSAKAKAALGEWIVVAEYDDNGNVLFVHAKKVDGKELKADTFYQAKDGKLIKESK